MKYPLQQLLSKLIVLVSTDYTPIIIFHLSYLIANRFFVFRKICFEPDSPISTNNVIII